MFSIPEFNEQRELKLLVKGIHKNLMDSMMCHGQEFVLEVRGLEFNENYISNEVMDAKNYSFRKKKCQRNSKKMNQNQGVSLTNRNCHN